MTTAEALRCARRLYEARPSHAAPNDIPEGRSVCAVTAIYKSASGSTYNDAYALLLRAAGAVQGELAAWNAKHSTEEVLAAFDRAIELTEASS